MEDLSEAVKALDVAILPDMPERASEQERDVVYMLAAGITQEETAKALHLGQGRILELAEQYSDEISRGKMHADAICKAGSTQNMLLLQIALNRKLRAVIRDGDDANTSEINSLSMAGERIFRISHLLSLQALACDVGSKLPNANQSTRDVTKAKKDLKRVRSEMDKDRKRRKAERDARCA